MNKLHMELNLLTTTALVLGLMSSFPVSAAELELKPTFDNPGIQVAAITFLPDWMGEGNTGEIGIDINIDSKWCEEKGYVLSCPNQQAVYETCERDTNYVKCNKATWCKNNNYKTSSCSLPSYLDQQCPNGEKLYKGCKENKPQACKDVGYVNTCPSGQKLYNTNNRCSWDNSFGKCCTPSGCPANTSTSGTYGDSGSKDSCGYACKYTCNMSCPSGTTEYNPGGCGGSTTNGCGTKTCYNPYKACCDNHCEGSTPCSSSYYQTTSRDGCGNTCYNCYSGKVYEKRKSAYPTGSGRNYTVVETIESYCQTRSGSKTTLGSYTQTLGCWDCDYSYASCAANCGTSCYHSNPTYSDAPYHDYSYKCSASWTGDYCN